MRAVFFGDSWTQGTNAQPKTRGFVFLAAERLGWDARFLGAGGSGYTRPGVNAGDYFSRLSGEDTDSTVEVVVMQGSLNDTRRFYTLPWNAIKTLRLARKKFPRAQIIVVGPAPANATPSVPLRACDILMSVSAAILRMKYISPIRQKWITPANWSQIIDAEYHPSTNGHEYLAARLVPALQVALP